MVNFVDKYLMITYINETNTFAYVVQYQSAYLYFSE